MEDDASPGLHPESGNLVDGSGRSSARFQAVVHSKNELLSAAAEYKASVGLTGSVARGEDDEDSDIDFYVYKFAAVDDGGPVDILRATEFVERIRTVLSPFKVDVFPLPGWPLGPAHEETMRRDAIPLEDVFAK